ncbi:unnamed protein product [Camellia sinensis]
MNPQQFLLVCLSLFLPFFTHLSLADVGTAASYAPPYIPTACSGNDGSQFPSSNLFAAAGEGIWDNGAACGRQYLVRCISAAAPNSCNPSQTIQVKIVDRAQTSASRPSRGGTTMVLSATAFGAIANGSPPSINIEFQQRSAAQGIEEIAGKDWEEEHQEAGECNSLNIRRRSGASLKVEEFFALWSVCLHVFTEEEQLAV